MLGGHPERSISFLIAESPAGADDSPSFFGSSFDGCQEGWLIAIALISRKSSCFGRALDSYFLVKSVVVVVGVGAVVSASKLHRDVFVGVSNSFGAQYGCPSLEFQQRIDAVDCRFST